jgi:hypothetical protein
MPDFPSIVSNTLLDGLKGSLSVNGSVTLPGLNKIFHNKKVHKQNIKRVDPNTFDEVTEQEWRIPFTVDNNLPVSEITERIDKAMDKLRLYTYWRINYNDYTISAFIRLQGHTA